MLTGCIQLTLPGLHQSSGGRSHLLGTKTLWAHCVICHHPHIYGEVRSGGTAGGHDSSTHAHSQAPPWQAARGGHWPPPASYLWKIPSSFPSGLLCMASLPGQRPELLSAVTSGGDMWIGITLKIFQLETP